MEGVWEGAAGRAEPHEGSGELDPREAQPRGEGDEGGVPVGVGGHPSPGIQYRAGLGWR